MHPSFVSGIGGSATVVSCGQARWTSCSSPYNGSFSSSGTSITGIDTTIHWMTS
jgi:hypothetical protein